MAEISQIIAEADTTNAGAREQTLIDTTLATPAGVDGKVLLLYDAAGSVGFWIDTDDSGTLAPAEATAANRSVEITTVVTGNSDAQIAAAIEAAIVADSEFQTAVALVGTAFTVEHVALGTVPDSIDGVTDPTGFAISTSQQGVDVDVGLTGSGFILKDDVGSVGFWIDVDDAGAVAPADVLAADRQVEITTITAGMLDTQVATQLQIAVSGDSKFGATVNSATVVITDAATGDRVPDLADSVNVGTGFTFSVTTQGVSEVDQVDELFLIHASSQGIWGDKIGVKVITTDDRIVEPNSFIIEVYKFANQATPVETFFVSRDEAQLDGFGRNMYLEEVLQSSNYINAQDNVAIDNAILPLAQATILFMGAGDDGLAVTDGDMITASDKLSNPDDLFTTVLMDGGFATAAYGQQLASIAEARQDSVALLSVPFAAEASANYLNDIIDYRKTDLNLNSSYAALYTPHVRIFDKFNDRNLFVSPDGYAGAAVSYSASNFEIWFPAAGFKRGLVNVLDLRRRFTKGEMGTLYDNGINPIRFAPGKGIAIWGQKTLLSRPSALDRLNVRLMLISIEPGIKEALEDFLFDLNDQPTRSLAVAVISGALDTIQARRGITEFQVIADTTNNTANDIDNHIMNIDIFVRPTPSLEFIKARVIITSQGISFSLAAELV